MRRIKGYKPNFAGLALQNLEQMAMSPDDYNPLDFFQQIASESARARPDRMLPGAPGTPGRTVGVPGSAGGPGKGPKGITELFYDPLGGIKYGQQIGAIGGHNDHVHFASENPRQMLSVLAQARRMGMHEGENPYVGAVNPVHVTHSWHYRDFGGKYNGRKLGKAVDISGTPKQMAALYRWVQKSYGR
jgi:hypothetical protein